MASRSEQSQLDALVAEHAAIRARLTADERDHLGKLAAHVRRQLFAAPLPPDLLAEATRIVSAAIDALTPREAATLAVYALDDIAGQALADVTAQMQETQMSYNLQYLQLQSQMQHENRSYTAVSNIMKTRHDTVANSIDNIR